MTTKSGKSPVPDQPVVADGSSPKPRNGDTEAVMQTDSRNGVAIDAGKAVIGSDIQGHLGRKLKASYDELVRQPVPDKFRQLLEELERREKKE